MGQEWDWFPEIQGAVLHLRELGGSEPLYFTEAGILGGKIGLNARGVGLCINGMVSAHDDWARLGEPFHLRTFNALYSSLYPGKGAPGGYAEVA